MLLVFKADGTGKCSCGFSVVQLPLPRVLTSGDPRIYHNIIAHTLKSFKFQ